MRGVPIGLGVGILPGSSSRAVDQLRADASHSTGLNDQTYHRPMDRRTLIFVLTGALLVATATLLSGLSLDPGGCSGPTAYVDASFCPPQFEILWFRLSETEVVVWSLIVGGSAGVLLGLLAHRLSSGRMRARRARWRIGTSFILLIALAACSRTPTETSFARYSFEAREARGVLEVTKSPPSICYSTQSNPARPITIIVRDSLLVVGPYPGVTIPPAASFAPRENDFCGTVSPDLAAGLLAEPSGYLVRWHPLAGEPIAESSFLHTP
jgi:hypothetical protein